MFLLLSRGSSYIRDRQQARALTLYFHAYARVKFLIKVVLNEILFLLLAPGEKKKEKN
jgi:hypothetical protein